MSRDKAQFLRLYKAANDAETVFSAACKKQFGKAAGDKRYQPRLYNVATEKASRRFMRATSALHAAFKKTRVA